MSAPVEKRYTIAVDFDGVLHSYTSGWQGADVIPDPPVAGAIEWLNEIWVDYDVVIHSTRGDQEGALEAIHDWLVKHGYIGPLPLVTSRKVPALVYIDDRAWRFRGTFPTARQIRYSRPWRTGDAEPRGTKVVIGEKNKQIRALEEKLHRAKYEAREAKRLAREEVLRELIAIRLGRDATDDWLAETAGIDYHERLELALGLVTAP